MPLKLEKVSYRYGRATSTLFENVSAEWHTGSLVAIQGPSGSGKSTLLDLIGGLRSPTSGSITLTHEGTKHERANRRSASSWILQNNAVLSGRTTVDNVMIGATARGASVAEARISALAALEYLGLTERASTLVNTLSGGEQQRVTIARCLISPSLVIIADEPTGNLDATNADLVAQSLRAAARAGKIVLVATHDPDVANACDSVLALREVAGW